MESAIEAVLERLAEAWARGDAAAYAAEFTADATYVTWVGTVYRGRDDIATGHDALFGKYLKGTRMFTELVSLQPLDDRAAIAVTRGDVAKKHPRRLTKVQTFTLVREGDGQWRVAAFQNTKHHRLMEDISFRTLPASRPAAQLSGDRALLRR
ncbi:SgcJ/EcaC family oxidoreductase [Kribbella sp. NPDC020789]